MVSFESTEDYQLVRRIITDPAVYPHVSDDFSPPSEKYEPPQKDGWHYVLVLDGKREALGLFTFVPQNAICWEVHTCLLPRAWGEQAKRAGAGVIGWIWENTICQRIVTNVPAYNRLALRYARNCGLTEYGRNPASYMKHGKLHDQILLGISR